MSMSTKPPPNQTISLITDLCFHKVLDVIYQLPWLLLLPLHPPYPPNHITVGQDSVQYNLTKQILSKYSTIQETTGILQYKSPD